MPTDDLHGEADWDLAILSRGLDLDSLTSISGDYRSLCDVWSVVSESAPSSIVVLFSLATRSVEAMSRPSILEAYVAPSESTL